MELNEPCCNDHILRQSVAATDCHCFSGLPRLPERSEIGYFSAVRCERRNASPYSRYCLCKSYPIDHEFSIPFEKSAVIGIAFHIFLRSGGPDSILALPFIEQLCELLESFIVRREVLDRTPAQHYVMQQSSALIVPLALEISSQFQYGHYRFPCACEILWV